MRRKLMNDLINQCQLITTSCEQEWPEQAQAAIDKARKLLDGLEVLCGTARKPASQERKAS